MYTARSILVSVIGRQASLSTLKKDDLLEIIKKNSYSDNPRLKHYYVPDLIKIILNAEYLDAADAIDRELKDYKKRNDNLGRAIRESFEESRTPSR